MMFDKNYMPLSLTKWTIYGMLTVALLTTMQYSVITKSVSDVLNCLLQVLAQHSETAWHITRCRRMHRLSVPNDLDLFIPARRLAH